MAGWLTVVAIAGVLSGAAAGGEKTPAKQIVFVCEHGSVKSLIAMQLFNQAAANRGLAVRAVSRGLTPDPSVPPAIAAHLDQDGLAPKGFTPAAFSKADLPGAERVIAIGAAVEGVTRGSAVPVESWNDIPAASENYAASRDALRARIETLLATRQGAKPRD